MVKEISVYEITELQKQGDECQVIDVREYSEFDSERIANIRLMSLSNFEKYTAEIDRSRPVYIMCQSGNRATRAAQWLAANGFDDVYVIRGGMSAWSQADLPIIKGESKTWSLERQVRFAAGVLVLIGVILGFSVSPYLFLICGFVGAGLTFSGITDFCGMGMLLAKMPWNRHSA